MPHHTAPACGLGAARRHRIALRPQRWRGCCYNNTMYFAGEEEEGMYDDAEEENGHVNGRGDDQENSTSPAY